MPRPAAHVDQPAVHLAAHPVARIPLDLDPPRRHLAPHVPPRVARNLNLAAVHLGADPMYPRQLPLKAQPPVARVARDLKQLPERQLLLAVKHHPPCNLPQRLPRHAARRDPFHLNRHAPGGPIAQHKRHRSTAPYLGCSTPAAHLIKRTSSLPPSNF